MQVCLYESWNMLPSAVCWVAPRLAAPRHLMSLSAASSASISSVFLVVPRSSTEVGRDLEPGHVERDLVLGRQLAVDRQEEVVGGHLGQRRAGGRDRGVVDLVEDLARGLGPAVQLGRLGREPVGQDLLVLAQLVVGGPRAAGGEREDDHRGGRDLIGLGPEEAEVDLEREHALAQIEQGPAAGAVEGAADHAGRGVDRDVGQARAEPGAGLGRHAGHGDAELLGEERRHPAHPAGAADHVDPADLDAGVGAARGQGLAQVAGQRDQLGDDRVADPLPGVAGRRLERRRDEAVGVLGPLGLGEAEPPRPGDRVGDVAAAARDRAAEDRLAVLDRRRRRSGCGPCRSRPPGSRGGPRPGRRTGPGSRRSAGARAARPAGWPPSRISCWARSRRIA